MELDKKKIGEEIQKQRNLLGMSQGELARRSSITQPYLSEIESGKKTPSLEVLTKIAIAMGVFVPDFLHQDTSEVTPYVGIERRAITGTSVRLDTNEKMEIPVISMRTPACAGDGNGVDYLELEAEETYLIDRDAFSVFDDMHKPFGVYVEGDSMEEQGILDGEIAIVNPAEEVNEGDIALVSFKGQWSIKGVEFLPDKSVRLRAGKPQYERIVPADIAEDRYWFRIIGKVVFSQPPRKRPKRFV